MSLFSQPFHEVSYNLNKMNVCAERKSSKLGGILTVVVLAVVLGAGMAGYIFYKYRLRVSKRASFFFMFLFWQG